MARGQWGTTLQSAAIRVVDIGELEAFRGRQDHRAAG